MAGVRILVVDPGSAPDGAGFCVLIATPSGSDAPTVSVSADDGSVMALEVRPESEQGSLWSAYLDDGVTVGSEDSIEAKLGGCVRLGSPPIRSE